MPYIDSLYAKYNKNQAGLIVLSAYILGETDAQVLQHVSNYKIPYPSISGTGGGKDISALYKPAYTPTIILMAPDKKIVEKDLNYTLLIPSLQKYPISTGVKINFTKKGNPGRPLIKNFSKHTIEIYIPVEGVYDIGIFNAAGQQLVLMRERSLLNGNISISFKNNPLVKGIYFVDLKGRSNCILKGMLF